MAKHVTLKDANNQNIYPRTFAQNVYMSDGTTTIEDKINNMGGAGNIPEGDFVTTDVMTTAINNAVSTKYTKPSTGIPASDLADDYVTESELTSKNYAAQSSVDTKYTKPSTGIPKTDLASDIQTSLGKADTALQSIPAEYVTETELTNKNYDTVTSVNSKDTSTLNSAKAYTDEKIASLVNGAPETLDTLDELAEALNDNADIIDTLNNAIGNKANTSDVTASLATKADKTDLNSYVTKTGYTMRASSTVGEFYYNTGAGEKSISVKMPTIPVTSVNGATGDVVIDTSKYVTTNTAQKIEGAKAFTGQVGNTQTEAGVYLGLDTNAEAPNANMAITSANSAAYIDMGRPDVDYDFRIIKWNTADNKHAQFVYGGNAAGAITIPQASGVMALTSDIPSKIDANNPNTFIGYNSAENVNSFYQVAFKDNDQAKGICWSKFANISNGAAVNGTSSTRTPSGCTTNGFYYVTSSTNSLSGADANPFLQYHTSNNDFRILTTAYSDQWLQQIATDFRSDHIYYRRRENGTWTDWVKVGGGSGLSLNTWQLTENGTSLVFSLK